MLRPSLFGSSKSGENIMTMSDGMKLKSKKWVSSRQK